MARFISPLVILFSLWISLFAQGHQIIFKQQDYNSLANWVRCMYQDSRGFIWVGTVNELQRFDGYDIVHYEPQPHDTASISGNYIQCILEDHEGMLWIGTFSDGLNMYNRYTDKFTRYVHDEDNPFSISGNRISAIYEDQEHILWIGASDALNRFDRKTKRFVSFQQKDKWIANITGDKSGLLWVSTWSGLFIFDPIRECFFPFGEYFETEDVFRNQTTLFCVRDPSDNFWIGTNDLYQFNPKTRQLIHFPIKTTDRQPTYSDRITSIVDDNDFLWIGKRNGLYRFDRKNNTFTWHAHNPANQLSICEDDITAILKDKSGCYWFSGWSKGVSKRNSIRKGVKYYLPNPFEAGSIEDAIRTLFLSKSGKIWIGTAANGFLSFNKHTEQFRLFQHDPGNPNSLSHNDVRCIIEDRNGSVWIGTYEGLNKFDPAIGRFNIYKYSSQNENSLSHIRIRSLLETSDGSIYVGTSGGFNHFNQASEKFTRYLNNPDDPHSISNNTILAIYEDNEHFIWIGTEGGGLNRFDPKTRQFTHYKNDAKNTFSISSNTVQSIYEFPYENRPTLWIGTGGGGLCRFDKQTEQFFTYSKKDGLPDNKVREIISDKKGNLWLAIAEQITMFNPNRWAIKKYEISAEMPVNPNTCLIDDDGEIFFGGLGGMIRFFPDSLKNNPYRPPIVITNLRVNNQPAQLDTVITEKKRIVLSHMNNNLNFEFAALDFNCPEMNQYAYKMEGLDKEWIYTDATRRYAAYTYIDPGNYVLRIKGSNNDGVWNEEGASIKIIITPPWWQTSWAYVLYIIFFCTGLITTWRLQTRRIRIRHELKMKSFEAQKLQEIDRLKSNFFANISHEFRTPLTLILGPVSKVLTKTRNKAIQYDLQLVIRNARRLQRLINQLLDLSKLEIGKMSLQAQETDLMVFLNRIVQSFESQAKLKNIKLSFVGHHKFLPAFIDREKLENILYNLLSNAFKFTPDGGKILVRVASPEASTDGFIHISVSDTGKGIPADKMAHIFDRFYQVDDSYTKGQEGSGIGLALTRELVERHHGKIEVTSKPGEGTTFTIFIPAGKDHLKPDEIVDTTDLALEEEIEKDTEPVRVKKSLTPKSFPIILAVEDNSDMRAYLEECLKRDYRLLEAADGKDGLQKALKHTPDLIISDVMMPHMDGFTFCGKIKTDQRTSHIPVILLTARADAESKIAGLETGADDYLSKPFDARELKVRVKNLIEQRRKLRERFSRDVNLKPLDMAFNTTDEKFLQRLIELIENNITNPGFRVETFVREMGMSRAQLYRKLQALCGQSVKAFVRIVRLKQAALLLKHPTTTIAEVAYRVGFNNPAYFSECFRKQFGLLPSQYEDKAKH